MMTDDEAAALGEKYAFNLKECVLADPNIKKREYTDEYPAEPGAIKDAEAARPDKLAEWTGETAPVAEFGWNWLDNVIGDISEVKM